MHPASSRAVLALTVIGLVLAGGCGGGSDGTPPVTVASVLITSPANAPSFATLGRTVQFAAAAKDAGGATLPNQTITWSSTNTSVATVSGSGLVTAAANGTTSITASSGGHTSPGTTVTVQQVAASVVITPSSVAFGAIGSMRQLTAAVKDSGGADVAGAPAATWTHAGNGVTASVSVSGLVTALGVGATDTAVATASSFSATVPISVTQVVFSVTVSSAGSDTLRTTGRTKTYTAAAKDSNTNAIGSAAFTWGSSATGVATVNSNTGVATSVADGNANITATASGSSTSGSKTLVVQRYAATFSLSPNTPQTIITNAGTLMFTGTAQDSVPTNLTITWTSKNTAVISLSPASGTSPSTGTATGAGNGSTYVVMAGGTRKDSAQVTVSNQTTAPPSAGVTVGNDFFLSVHNASNPAVDTVAAGGTVTWTWAAASVGHNVNSSGSPTFTPNSTTLTTGMFTVTFANPGTYGYYCNIHGSPGSGMFGTVVVR